MGNPTSAYRQFSSNSSRTGKNRRAGPKTFVYTNLGDFSSKKANLGNIWTFEVLRDFLKFGLEARFSPVPVQCKVPQNARRGEPYTF
jgi:hypothetical protein